MTANGHFEVRACSPCAGDGVMWDEGAQRWVAHDGCQGTGNTRTFLYAKAPAGDPGKRLRECESCRERFTGRDLYEVCEEHGSLTWFVGDELCHPCARRHGIL